MNLLNKTSDCMSSTHKDLEESYLVENALNEFRNINMNERFKQGRKEKCALKTFLRLTRLFHLCVLYKILLECSKLNHIKVIKALLEMTS